MVPKGPDAAAHPHPDAEEAAETAKSTMEALNSILSKRVAANNPKAIGDAARPAGPQYIKYTPKTATVQHNSGVDHRIIQMQEMPKDPLDPPKFRHQKHYRVMVEEPTPLMHSPPKKLTRDEQEKFSIPPCVSAWKNNKARPLFTGAVGAHTVHSITCMLVYVICSCWSLSPYLPHLIII